MADNEVLLRRHTSALSEGKMNFHGVRLAKANFTIALLLMRPFNSERWVNYAKCITRDPFLATAHKNLENGEMRYSESFTWA